MPSETLVRPPRGIAFPLPLRRSEEELTVLGRLLIAAEVLAAYGPAYRRLRRNDLEGMIGHARRGPLPGRGLADDEPSTVATRLAWIVLRTLRLLPTDSRCLAQALVLTRVLRRRGIDTELVIGVRTDGAGFAAHAWVECEGRPLLPATDFEPIFRR